MQPPRGAKKSPFVGRTEPLVDNKLLLYPRYQHISELLLEPEKQQEGSPKKPIPGAANTPDTNGKLKETPPPLNTVLNIDAAANGSANGAPSPEVIGGLSPVEEERPVKRPKREKKKKEKKHQERVLVSGTSNLEEAQHIRGVFGFKQASEGGDKVPASAGSFSFGFGVPAGSTQGAQDAAPTAVAASAAAPTSEDPLPAAEAPSEPASDHNRQANGNKAELSGRTGESLVPRRVFVGGMPFSLEEDEIREYWSYCGDIEEMDLMRFPDTGRFKGIAFITFKTEEACEEALKCNDTEVDGQHIRVERCKSAGYKGKAGEAGAAPDTTKPPPPKKPAQKTAGYHVAYVGNIAFAVGAHELHELFKDCDCKKVRLHTDRHTGQSKGFAHVHFKDEAALDKAMALDGSELNGPCQLPCIAISRAVQACTYHMIMPYYPKQIASAA
ncbi:hypothetical protein WJX74_002389 [Apatococcus lobatus]|uniref:RRM domain-containing protein n=2 Tax=Apatococcus TaxID=904362 RepID=A0AAW1SYE9_9CHLO